MKPKLRNTVKRFLPESLHVARALHIWRRNDPSDWPLVDRRNLSGLHRYEYSVFSQNGEDGILRYVFSQIGFRSRYFVEFGFGATQNNALRLALRENFRGIFIDASKTTVDRFNRAASIARMDGIRAHQAFLTAESINQTISAAITGDIDFLSIDVDGNDYWLWKELDTISPRVVSVEYNAAFGPDRSVTVPYDSSFTRHEKHASGFYCGASLTALWKLGAEKQYSLICCDSAGVNAFFVRNDCLADIASIPPVEPSAAFRAHARRVAQGLSSDAQFAQIRHLPLETV